jgi:hypothetical protein
MTPPSASSGHTLRSGASGAGNPDRGLLRHTGLHGPLTDGDVFLRFFRELAKSDDAATDWAWLDRTIQQTPRLPPGPAEKATLESISTRHGPVVSAHIERFGTGKDPANHLVASLDSDARDALRHWLRLLSPIGQYVTRHSRETLHRYRKLGLLSENLAERDVQPTIISFTRQEQELYDELERLIDRLMTVHGTRQGAGFVLTVYRRRLTSSWAAIRKTLSRRLGQERLEVDDDLIEEEEVELDSHDALVDDSQAVPLSPDDVAEVRAYLDRISSVGDSKLERLRRDIDDARSAGHSTIVFSQFTDTVTYLRDALRPSYGSQLATFTGEGGHIFRDTDGWVRLTKRDLIAGIRARTVTVIVANDAASEGLNLQACSYLVNYDMPWNPMKAEQRIGRIDRLGQPRDVIHVRNYFIPNTIEQSVYTALAGRIDNFRDLLGALQPILGATERTFQTVFRAPRSERAAAEKQAIDELLNRVDVLEETGLDLSAEDPMPIPEAVPSPVTLADLHTTLVERFGAVLDQPGQPVTWDPARASRDPDGWAALGRPQRPVVNVTEPSTELVSTSGERTFGHASSSLFMIFSRPAALLALTIPAADRTRPSSGMI